MILPLAGTQTKVSGSLLASVAATVSVVVLPALTDCGFAVGPLVIDGGVFAALTTAAALATANRVRLIDRRASPTELEPLPAATTTTATVTSGMVMVVSGRPVRYSTTGVV